jgi:hypothetical protein
MWPFALCRELQPGMFMDLNIYCFAMVIASVSGTEDPGSNRGKVWKLLRKNNSTIQGLTKMALSEKATALNAY